MRDDLISRQAAIEATYDVLASYSYIDEPGSDVAERVENILKEMPTVQPEQKTGRWELAIGYDPKRRVMCDQCRKMAYEPSKYCPNCGAKMEG